MYSIYGMEYKINDSVVTVRYAKRKHKCAFAYRIWVCLVVLYVYIYALKLNHPIWCIDKNHHALTNIDEHHSSDANLVRNHSIRGDLSIHHQGPCVGSCAESQCPLYNFDCMFLYVVVVTEYSCHCKDSIPLFRGVVVVCDVWHRFITESHIVAPAIRWPAETHFRFNI